MLGPGYYAAGPRPDVRDVPALLQSSSASYGVTGGGTTDVAKEGAHASCGARADRG